MKSQDQSTPSPPIAGGGVSLDLAVSHFQARRFVEAEAVCRRYLSGRPKDADALHLLGLSCIQQGKLEGGAGFIQDALAQNAEFGVAHYNLGNALRRLNRYEDAAEAYRRAAALMPDHLNCLVNLGATLRELDRAEEAVEVYRRALTLKGDAPEVHYNLGRACQHLGRLEQAIDAYRRSLALNPSDADAWTNLGEVLTQAGRFAEAAAACRRRCALEPMSSEAQRSLAAALLETGQAEPAVEAARRAVALAPEDGQARLQLGNALLECGETDAALAAYRQAVERGPDDVAGWVNLAVGLQEAGRTDAARSAVAEALNRDQGSAPAWAVWAGLKTFHAGDADIQALSALRDSALSKSDRVHVEFTLGKVFMDLGEVDQAFAHLDAGNRLHRATLTYDVQADVAQFATLAQVFDAESLNAPAGSGRPSDRPVFIVGMPRSGTTLVEQILASHPQVFGAGELSLLERLIIEKTGPHLAPTDRARRLGRLDGGDLAALGAAYVEAISRLDPSAQRITDKMPANFRFAGLIRRMLPNARIINCRRNPLDVGLSCYARRFSRGQGFTYDLHDLGVYHRAYDALTAHWRRSIPVDRWLDVDYEAVVGDLETEARRLIAFLGLDWDGACLDFHRNGRVVRTASVNQVRQPIYRSAVARWKPYERHLEPMRKALAGEAGPS
jgi:tetratricopeptide (TPR) repeat protein